VDDDRHAVARQALGDGAADAPETPVTTTTRSRVVVDQAWGACYHRLLLPDQPLTDDFADALVADLFDGVGGAAAKSLDRAGGG
jgi:hypothetical protein